MRSPYPYPTRLARGRQENHPSACLISKTKNDIKFDTKSISKRGNILFITKISNVHGGALGLGRVLHDIKITQQTDTLQSVFQNNKIWIMLRIHSILCVKNLKLFFALISNIASYRIWNKKYLSSLSSKSTQRVASLSMYVLKSS